MFALLMRREAAKREKNRLRTLRIIDDMDLARLTAAGDAALADLMRLAEAYEARQSRLKRARNQIIDRSAP